MIDTLRVLGLSGVMLMLAIFATTAYLATRPLRPEATWFSDLARLRSWLTRRVGRWRRRWPRVWWVGHVLVVILAWALKPVWWLIDSTTALRGGTPPSLQPPPQERPSTEVDWDAWAADLIATSTTNVEPGPNHPSTNGRAEHGIVLDGDGRAADPARQHELDAARRAEEREWITKDRQAQADLLAQQQRLLELQHETNRQTAAFNQHTTSPAHNRPAQAGPVMRYRRPLSLLGVIRIMVGVALVAVFAMAALAQAVGPPFLDWVDQHQPQQHQPEQSGVAP